jgi:plasmid stabilization system protein ParE
MELRWTQEAAADLERIADHLFEHTPGHAERLVRALYGAPVTLLTFPDRGTAGKKEGTANLSCRRSRRRNHSVRAAADGVVDAEVA